MSIVGKKAGGKKLGTSVLFVLLAVTLFAVLGNFVWLGYINGQDREYLTTSDRIQVLSQSIVKYSNEAANGNHEAFAELATTRKDLQDSILALNTTDGQLPFVSIQQSLGAELENINKSWSSIAEASGTISGNEVAIKDMSVAIARFNRTLNLFKVGAEEVSRRLLQSGASPSLVFYSTQQVVLADRMSKEMVILKTGGAEAFTAAEDLKTDNNRLIKTVNGLLNGDPELGIVAVRDRSARETLENTADTYIQIDSQLNKILIQYANLVFALSNSKEQIYIDSEALKLHAEVFSQRYQEGVSSRLLPSVLSGLALAVISAVFLVAIAFSFYRQQVDRAKATELDNQRNQEAILRLLDELSTLAEGDLSTNATVTEDITGAIADSINFAIDALRSLVTNINETTVNVASSAQETQSTAMQLAEASEHQAQQITSASAAVNEIAVSIDEVSKNAAESAEVAQRSVAIAHRGGDIVRQSIDGMDNIREQIQETSKRIKRLGESSQEIGDIVELINDISEQTNILALNAAIQASSAGEAGRGFAVVADEVQRLAERSSNATRRIETLVKTIQADTNEAVESMEVTTSQVVRGAELAENAGDALTEIERVSNDLADLIQNISEAARQQSAAATNISGTMNVIQEITTQTSEGTRQTADSIGNLSDLSGELRKSVADFKLPE